MATRALRAEHPLVVIVGPTASGKTSAAIKLAQQVNGEIICADSRTIYEGMDIGTAKPTMAEREDIPHWGLDLVEPDQQFTVADFKRYAEQKIADIRARGKVPLLVGGSGLYVDSVIFNYEFGEKADVKKRAYLENLSLQELYDYCQKNNVALPENRKNKRYVIRAIERKGRGLQRRSVPDGDIIIVGIATEKSILQRNIKERSEQIFTQAVIEESADLGKKYGWEFESMTGNIYPLIRSYLKGEESLYEVKEKFIRSDQKLAKRQLTWFRRNPYIIWLSRDELSSYVQSLLAA